MTGIVAAGGGFGIMTMPLLINWLISVYGWRISYVTIGIITLVLIVTAAQFLKRDPSELGLLPHGEIDIGAELKNSALQTSGLSLNVALHTRQFWILSITTFIASFILNLITVHIVIHATGLGISPVSAAAVLSTVGGVSIAGRITLGIVADRIGNKAALVIGFTLTFLSCILLFLAKEELAFYFFAILLGSGGWAWVVLVSPIVADLFGLRAHGVVYAVVMFAGTIGGAVGPIIAGYIFDIAGSYMLAFTICAIGGIISLLLMVSLKPIKGMSIRL